VDKLTLRKNDSAIFGFTFSDLFPVKVFEGACR